MTFRVPIRKCESVDIPMVHGRSIPPDKAVAGHVPLNDPSTDVIAFAVRVLNESKRHRGRGYLRRFEVGSCKRHGNSRPVIIVVSLTTHILGFRVAVIRPTDG